MITLYTSIHRLWLADNASASATRYADVAATLTKARKVGNRRFFRPAHTVCSMPSLQLCGAETLHMAIVGLTGAYIGFQFTHSLDGRGEIEPGYHHGGQLRDHPQQVLDVRGLPLVTMPAQSVMAMGVQGTTPRVSTLVQRIPTPPLGLVALPRIEHQTAPYSVALKTSYNLGQDAPFHGKIPGLLLPPSYVQQDISTSHPP